MTTRVWDGARALRAASTAVALSVDAVLVPVGGRDGVLVVSGVAGRFDLSLAHLSRAVYLRGTAMLSVGGVTATQLADATHPVHTAGGFGSVLFVGPTLTFLGYTNTHISIGPAALLGLPDGLDTTFAFGGQARIAFDFGTHLFPESFYDGSDGG